MVTTVNSGLVRAREIYQNRPQRVQELRAQGKKIIGYICLYPALEMMTALDLVPYRIFGDMDEPITKADIGLLTVSCPFLRSCLDLQLKGKTDFLDGIVIAHACDAVEKLALVWNVFVQTPYAHFIDTPHSVHLAAQEQEKGQLQSFQKSLEAYTGKILTNKKLQDAIKLHNRQRALVLELYDLKKPEKPLISGVETLQVLVAIMSIPVEEGNRLLEEVIGEIKTREVKQKPVRLLMWGSVMHDTSLLELIENLGADIVMDDTCVGTRAFFDDVKLTPDPLDGLAQHYLVDIRCPRTFREACKGEARNDYKRDLENRFGYVGEYIRDWKVKGVILRAIRYCDSHAFEIPEIKDYLDIIGIPSIYLEDDYSKTGLAPSRIRIQGFLEIMS
jgi:benzoyl-CoA reductase subunit C